MAKQGHFLGWETTMHNGHKMEYSPLLLVTRDAEILYQLNPRHTTLTSQLEDPEQTPICQCSLCGYNCCTMLHIFNCCQYSLRTERYNWRHDMVLREIVHQLVPTVLKARWDSWRRRSTECHRHFIQNGDWDKVQKCTMAQIPETQHHAKL